MQGGSEDLTWGMKEAAWRGLPGGGDDSVMGRPGRRGMGPPESWAVSLHPVPEPGQGGYLWLGPEKGSHMCPCTWAAEQGGAGGGGGNWGLKLVLAKLWGLPLCPPNPDDLLMFHGLLKSKNKGGGGFQQAANGLGRRAVPGRPGLCRICRPFSSLASPPPIPAAGRGQRAGANTFSCTSDRAEDTAAVLLPSPL